MKRREAPLDGSEIPDGFRVEAQRRRQSENHENRCQPARDCFCEAGQEGDDGHRQQDQSPEDGEL